VTNWVTARPSSCLTITSYESGENAKLKEARNAKISFKVSEKKAVSCYGMGRFPITLYRGQWERLIQVIPQLQQSIADHADELAVKE
jgi:hypothetical protein